MTSRPRRIAAICLLILLAPGCGILPATVTPAAPQPQTTSASGQSAILFRVVPPPGTPSDASLSLIAMDPVTGLAYNSQDNPMQAMGDGGWQTTLNMPSGSLVYYRYVRNQPGPADEYTSRGDPVSYRLALVNGETLVDDAIAAWQDAPFTGATGRLVGRLTDAVTGEPIPELMVTAGGMRAFSDGEGAFRLDGLLRHGLEQRIHLVQANLFAGIRPPSSRRFDLICANLPYIPVRTLETLAVSHWEPRLALCGGDDGLDLIRRLLMDVPGNLSPGGMLLLEIERSLGQAVASLVKSILPYASIRVLPDLEGHDRLVVCQT